MKNRRKVTGNIRFIKILFIILIIGTTLCFFYGSIRISAQENVTTKFWGGPNKDYSNSIWIGNSSIYTAGWVEKLSFETNGTLIKWDINGTVMWNRTWGGRSKFMEVRGYNSSIYTVGTQKYCLILVKWDTDGNQIWNRTLKLHGDSSYGESLWVDETDIYIIGSTSSHLLLVKYNSDGQKIWEKINSVNTYYVGTASRTHMVDEGLAVIGSGKYVYTSGRHYVGFGTYVYTITKWNQDGWVIWDKMGRSLKHMWEDQTGIYTGGSYAYHIDTVIQKWDSNGEVIWDEYYEDMKATSIWGEGEYIYTSGYTSDNSALMKWSTDGSPRRHLELDVTDGDDASFGISGLDEYVFLTGFSNISSNIQTHLIKVPKEIIPDKRIPGMPIWIILTVSIGALVIISKKVIFKKTKSQKRG